MKFKTPKSMKGYKSEDDYLKSVFYRNRKEITAVFGQKGALRRFINNVKAQKVIGGGLTTKQALGKLARSTAFTPQEERFAENVQNALKNFNKSKEFQYLTRDEKGHFTKFDASKLRWDKNSRMYVYDNKVTIELSNSPEEILIGTLQ